MENVNLSPENSIYLIGLVLGLLVIWILSANKKKRPTRLNMRAGGQAKNNLTTQKAGGVESSGNWSAAREMAMAGEKQRRGMKEPEVLDEEGAQYEKELTVHFNFNGHSFDAFEVLGLPAGSSLDKARKAHKDMKEKLRDESGELVDAALQAILKNR